MRSHLRSFDPIVRFGGDEFVCGLGGADVEEVERRFDLIGRSVAGDVGVGFSVGLASLAEGETLDELTARADAALLLAKKRRTATGGSSTASEVQARVRWAHLAPPGATGDASQAPERWIAHRFGAAPHVTGG